MVFATLGTAPTTPLARGAMRCCDVCNAMYRTDFARCPTDGGQLVLAISDPLVGKTIAEHYVVDACIGEGAMGRVYRVHHSRLPHKQHALKIMLGDLAVSVAMRIRFANEAQSTSRLDHPNIVGVLDFGRTESGLLYLMMELVEGPSLGVGILRAGPMDPRRVIAIARQLAEGLDHAHARGVIHRDLKPDNILVAGETPRIADFGLAISLADDDARLTTTGIMCTPLYAAPEQLRGKPVDHRVDLYALGVTMYEMLTGGVLPFQGNPPEVIACKLAGAAPSILELAPHTPPRLADLVTRLLATDPGRRPGSASAVIAELDEVFATARALPSVPARRSIGRLAAAAALIAASGITLGWVARPHDLGSAAAQLAGADEPPPLQVAFAAPEAAAPALPVPTVAVAPVPRGEPRVTAAPRVVAPRPRRAPPRPRSVEPRIVQLDVDGALPGSVVRRAIERAMPALRGCSARVGGRQIVVEFSIEESRRALGVQVGGAGGGAACVHAAVATVRTEVAPDVGGSAVRARLAF